MDTERIELLKKKVEDTIHNIDIQTQRLALARQVTDIAKKAPMPLNPQYEFEKLPEYGEHLKAKHELDYIAMEHQHNLMLVQFNNDIKTYQDEIETLIKKVD
jgi:hypothetical protein